MRYLTTFLLILVLSLVLSSVLFAQANPIRKSVDVVAQWDQSMVPKGESHVFAVIYYFNLAGKTMENIVKTGRMNYQPGVSTVDAMSITVDGTEIQLQKISLPVYWNGQSLYGLKVSDVKGIGAEMYFWLNTGDDVHQGKIERANDKQTGEYYFFTYPRIPVIYFPKK